MIDPAEVAALIAAFRLNSNDIGVGLYNSRTGEIRLGSFDLVTAGRGHQGLADALGISDNTDWRGFIVTSAGGLVATSHFNLADGSLTMRPDLALTVETELRHAGLVY